MAFDKIFQERIKEGVRYTVIGSYVSYHHANVKSAINVV
jgi:hypothetical protein